VFEGEEGFEGEESEVDVFDGRSLLLELFGGEGEKGLDDVVEELVEGEPVDVGVDWVVAFGRGSFTVLEVEDCVPDFAEDQVVDGDL
jgi:hypothetical protein